MCWIVGIASVVLFFYWQCCRAEQVTMFNHKPYERGWVVHVGIGRTDGRLTAAKAQAIRNEGFEVFEPREWGQRPQIVIPAYGLTDMVIKAGEIGRRHHLMLLW